MKANLLRRVLAAKATAFVVLALIVAVVLGAASTAQAHDGDARLFHLNHSNAVSAISQLVGSVVGPILRIDNNSTGTGATALDLQVEPGKPPMTVNSSAKVANLNADQIDGLDQSAFLRTSGKAADSDKLDGVDSTRFLSRPPYPQVNTDMVGPGIDNVEAKCDPGDHALGGGFLLGSDAIRILGSRRIDAEGSPTGWRVDINTGSSGLRVTAEVYCWDLPPIR